MIYATLNGNVLPIDEVKIMARSRAVYYGDGCYELLRSYQGRFVALDRHIDRLKAGMKYLDIKISSAITEYYFAHIIEILLEKSELNDTDAKIRIQVWRNGEPGYTTEKESRGSFLVTVSPITERIRSIHLGIAEQKRIPQNILNTKYKLSNGIHYIIAERQAKEAGADGALMLTVDNFISQTPKSNIFWLKGGIIYTPADECDILPGISRKILMDLIEKETDYKINTGQFLLKDLNDAQAVWTINSIEEMVPVSQVGETRFQIDQPDLIKIRKKYKDKIRYLWL